MWSERGVLASSAVGAEPPVLELRGLSKRYGHVESLRGIDLRLEPGVTGLVGGNGAGKTTLLRILATTVRPSAGSVAYGTVDVLRRPDRLRADLGYLPQYVGTYPDLTAREFLAYCAQIRGLGPKAARATADEALQAVGLAEVGNRRLRAFSGGMRQRIGLAQALQANPRVILLDEPTASLDPDERLRLRELLRRTSANRIVVVCTHIVSDLEGLADSTIVLEQGRVVSHRPTGAPRAGSNGAPSLAVAR